ncbi:Copia protein [Bienertia sinuspersici]
MAKKEKAEAEEYQNDPLYLSTNESTHMQLSPTLFDGNNYLGNTMRSDYKKSNLDKKCSHCGMRGHIKEECFKIIGYPEWFTKSKGKGVQRTVANVNKVHDDKCEEVPLDMSEYRVESRGKKPDAELVNVVVHKVMVDLNRVVHVGLPDGSVTRVCKIESVQINPDIELNEVLYLPEFKHNLLSVSKLNEKSNVKVIFDKDGCHFQNPTT